MIGEIIALEVVQMAWSFIWTGKPTGVIGRAIKEGKAYVTIGKAIRKYKHVKKQIKDREWLKQAIRDGKVLDWNGYKWVTVTEMPS